jgi:hypothetical protein
LRDYENLRLKGIRMAEKEPKDGEMNHQRARKTGGCGMEERTVAACWTKRKAED